MSVEYKAIKMYADDKLHLIQKEIQQTQKTNFHMKYI